LRNTEWEEKFLSFIAVLAKYFERTRMLASPFKSIIMLDPSWLASSLIWCAYLDVKLKLSNIPLLLNNTDWFYSHLFLFMKAGFYLAMVLFWIFTGKK